jgi:hypothetical protein
MRGPASEGAIRRPSIYPLCYKLNAGHVHALTSATFDSKASQRTASAANEKTGENDLHRCTLYNHFAAWLCAIQAFTD